MNQFDTKLFFSFFFLPSRLLFHFSYLTAMPPTSTAGDHGPMATPQHCDNRPNTSQTTEQMQQQNLTESHTSPSPSTKKGSFFKKNVEDGMDRYYINIFSIFLSSFYNCCVNQRFHEYIKLNLIMHCSNDCRVLEQVNFQEKFSSLPEFKPEDIQSPSAISVNTPGSSSHSSTASILHPQTPIHTYPGYRKKSVQGPHRPTSNHVK